MGKGAGRDEFGKGWKEIKMIRGGKEAFREQEVKELKEMGKIKREIK